MMQIFQNASALFDTKQNVQFSISFILIQNGVVKRFQRICQSKVFTDSKTSLRCSRLNCKIWRPNIFFQLPTGANFWNTSRDSKTVGAGFATHTATQVDPCWQQSSCTSHTNLNGDSVHVRASITGSHWHHYIRIHTHQAAQGLSTAMALRKTLRSHEGGEDNVKY